MKACVRPCASLLTANAKAQFPATQLREKRRQLPVDLRFAGFVSGSLRADPRLFPVEGRF